MFDPSCHPQNLPPTELASPKLTRVGDSAIFWGWQVLDLVISEGGKFRTLFFFWLLAHREIWGWQEGSNTLYIPENVFSLFRDYTIYTGHQTMFVDYYNIFVVTLTQFVMNNRVSLVVRELSVIANTVSVRGKINYLY